MFKRKPPPFPHNVRMRRSVVERASGLVFNVSVTYPPKTGGGSALGFGPVSSKQVGPASDKQSGTICKVPKPHSNVIC